MANHQRKSYKVECSLCLPMKSWNFAESHFNLPEGKAILSQGKHKFIYFAGNRWCSADYQICLKSLDQRKTMNFPTMKNTYQKFHHDNLNKRC